MATRFADLAGDLGLETHPSGRRVGKSIQMLAEDAMRQTRLLVNNPREVSYEDAVEIMNRLYNGAATATEMDLAACGCGRQLPKECHYFHASAGARLALLV